MYNTEIKKNCLKFISKLDEKRIKRITEFLIEFEKDFTRFAYKKLVNRQNEYRVRFSEFRITYHKNKDKLVITVIKIGFRENYYSK